MQNEDAKIIQIFLGIVLIILLVLIVFLVMRQPVNQDSNLVITNSYNTYTTYQGDNRDHWREVRDDREDEEKEYDWRKLDYSDWGKHYIRDGTMRKGFDEFIVYVRNEDDVGGYFTVKFYFDNPNGNIDSDKITYYLKANEGKKFVYKDIYETGQDYGHWNYEVFSDSKIRRYW